MSGVALGMFLDSLWYVLVYALASICGKVYFLTFFSNCPTLTHRSPVVCWYAMIEHPLYLKDAMKMFFVHSPFNIGEEIS